MAAQSSIAKTPHVIRLKYPRRFGTFCEQFRMWSLLAKVECKITKGGTLRSLAQTDPFCPKQPISLRKSQAHQIDDEM
jgi:hypothetical protein